MGREILEKEGLPKHGLVCERHIGVGISKAEIISQNLPLPARDMLLLSHEEKIICLADKFFGKSSGNLSKQKSIEAIIVELRKRGEEKVLVFKSLLAAYLD